jgi:hypothetical protein
MPSAFPARAGLAAAFALTLLLGACGGDEADRRSGADGTGDPSAETLPRPEGTGGSVTGMPDEPGPGPAEALPAEASTVDAIALGPDGLPLPPDAVEALDPTALDPALSPGAVAPPAADAAPEPGPAEAVAAVRAYYGAINAADYAGAHALWANGASGQTLDQFSAGFAGTASVVVDVGAPGRVEGAAGSRYIEVPVAVEARQRDGGVRRYVGAYTLRRAVADGAGDEQRPWRIASADIREVRP